MSHGGKVDHESGGPKFINCRGCSVRACGLNHAFKLSNCQLSIRLAQRDQANARGEQIRHVALKKGWQCQGERSAFGGKSNSENNGQGWRNLSFAKYFS